MPPASETRSSLACHGPAAARRGISGCSTHDTLGGYKAARTLHLAPDGRLIVADQGTGKHDGAVVAVDTVSHKRTVLLQNLPSTHDSGQAHADLAGPSGAAMASDGTVCVVIGDATTKNAGFATLRCTDSLVVDLEAFQARNELPNNPYDVVSDGLDAHRGHAASTDRQPAGDRRSPVEEGSDQPPGDAYVYAVRDEEAYLQIDEDEKPESIAEPPPDPAWFKCSFCRKTDRRVLFGAEYPVRDPNTLAVIALIFICDKCVANFAESLGQETPKAPPAK